MVDRCIDDQSRLIPGHRTANPARRRFFGSCTLSAIPVLLHPRSTDGTNASCERRPPEEIRDNSMSADHGSRSFVRDRLLRLLDAHFGSCSTGMQLFQQERRHHRNLNDPPALPLGHIARCELHTDRCRLCSCGDRLKNNTCSHNKVISHCDNNSRPCQSETEPRYCSRSNSAAASSSALPSLIRRPALSSR